MTRSSRRATPTTDHIRQQEIDHHPSQIWGTQAGNVCSLLLHPEIPQLPLPPKVHPESRQSSPILVENLLHGPSIDWTLDHDAGQVSLSCGTQTANSRNADGLSKRTNDYRCREQQLAQLPATGERWNFLSAEEFDNLTVAPWFDLQGRIIPNHPDLPLHLQNLEPKVPDQALLVLRRVQRANKRERQAKALAAPLPPKPPPVLQKHEDFYSDYPEDWIDVTTEASEDYLLPTHAVNVPSCTIYSVAGTSNAMLQNSPGGVRESIIALKDIDTELHEHTHTVHGIKDLVLAQNRDVHVLALKKLVQCESLDNDVFPENVREFARNYFLQKKDLLFINKNDVLCVQYSPTQRPLHERPCMIIMPQLYQQEILFRAHDAMGH